MSVTQVPGSQVADLGIGTNDIAANAVTNAKLAQMAAITYKGRHTASTGDPEDVSIANLQSDLGIPAPSTSGNVMTSNGSIWTSAASAGASSLSIWSSFPATPVFASATTITYTCANTAAASAQAMSLMGSLFTCTSADGNTRRIGWIQSYSRATTTMTITVVTDSDLVAGDISFALTLNRKIEDYIKIITIPGTIDLDASNSQGLFFGNNSVAVTILPVTPMVRTAAAGTPVLTFNLYDNTTALITSAPDLAGNTSLVPQRLTAQATSAAGNTLSLRIITSAGSTSEAVDFQCKVPITPTDLWTAT
jgi:hypothetical protein